MVLDHGDNHATAETLRKSVRQVEHDQGLRTGSTTAKQAGIRALEREAHGVEPICRVPPAQTAEHSYAQLEAPAMAA